jgi:CubicO group peptidase (beta-lactamase class C family)
MNYLTLTIVLVITIINCSCEKLFPGSDKIPPAPVKYNSSFATMLDSLRYVLDLPALAGVIITDDTILFADAVGCRRYSGPMNVTNDDRSNLGSNTKAFTAVLLGTLVDDGSIRWTTPLSEIFPEFAGSMLSEYKDITLKSNLSHSAGFVRDSHLNFISTTPMEQRKEVVEWALKQPPQITRGQFPYSNLGYIIAGSIAEKLTNKPFEDVLI